MQGDISLAIEREPDFFALARARGVGRTYVVESGGHVVACGSVCRRPAYVRGERTTIGYVGDLRVLPGHRRAGHARRILEVMAADERDADPSPYIGSAAAGNRAVGEMLRSLPGGNRVVRLGTFTAIELLPLRRRIGLLGVRCADDRDENELAEFLDTYHRRLTLAPVFAEGGLRRILASSPGMDLGSYRLVRRGGRILAAVGVWDASTVKQTRVRRLPASLRWTSRVARGIARLLPMPPFPAEGEVLRHVYLRHAAYASGALPALADIVRTVVAEAGAAGYQFTLFTCAVGDPIAESVRRQPRMTYRYDLYAGTNSADHARHLHELPGQRLYDDAALA